MTAPFSGLFTSLYFAAASRKPTNRSGDFFIVLPSLNVVS